MGPQAAKALALQLRQLAELKRWHPVGSLAQTIVEAMAGVGGLAPADVIRLSQWAARWREASPVLRAFYTEALSEIDHDHDDYPALSAGLWNLFCAHPINGPTVGRLHQIYRETMGGSPPFPLTRGRT